MQLKSETQQEICQQAINKKTHSLTDYQKQINKCSQDIEIQHSRGKLLEAAKHAVHESGYCFKKVIHVQRDI